MRIRRFTPIQKTFHLLLIVTFMTQAVTGMARMYSTTLFGKALGAPFGGYVNCLEIHKVVGVAMLLLFICHVIYALFLVLAGKVERQDSLIPHLRDFKEFFGHLRWMMGGKLPRFGRWAYWEKFDYWAVFWGMVLLGRTGLLLFDPIETARYIDGSELNIALWMHRLEAILAMGYIFLIHFGVVVLRKHSFPMDQAMWGGDADYETVQIERSEWLENLEASGQLDDLIIKDSNPILTTLSYLVGLGGVTLGVYLVIGGLMNAHLIPW
ncbi:formate dehydrogenase subunit gamma [Maridesulfovibrio ferrireducens]|uniref:formate dehydrogenase subunit gamma n=1 Tax=Maridesulfovibrio ferrireducens TaxID=246191 RepID=UPI001A25C0DD|nr:cytochrome b/b6 domain-containing protein [Maridesulfovibrio ferrireducens]MBI9112785.1 cytochrome b/b6 domain-containing protein [Maridesulfovibrio ferrireducens]